MSKLVCEFCKKRADRFDFFKHLYICKCLKRVAVCYKCELLSDSYTEIIRGDKRHICTSCYRDKKLKDIFNGI